MQSKLIIELRNLLTGLIYPEGSAQVSQKGGERKMDKMYSLILISQPPCFGGDTIGQLVIY